MSEFMYSQTFYQECDCNASKKKISKRKVANLYKPPTLNEIKNS